MTPSPRAARFPVLPVRPALRPLAGAAALGLLGVALARAPLELATALVAAAAGGLLLLRYPALGLYALGLAVPFGPLAAVTLAGAAVGPAQPLVALALASALAGSLAYRTVPSFRSALLPPSVLLLAVLAASLLSATALTPALTEMLKWVEFAAVLAAVGAWLVPVQRRWLVAALLLGGLAQGALGMVQFLRQIGPPGFVLLGRYMRAYGTFAQPNPYAGYLGLLLPLAYAVVLTRRPGRESPSGAAGDRALWWLALASTAAMAAGLVMSWSRGALLGLAAGLALVAFALARRTWPLLLVAALALAVSLPIWQPLLPGGDLLGRLDDTTAYLGRDLATVEVDDANFAVIERLAHWEAAWRMFSARPWQGVGVGQYAVVYPTVAVARWQDPLGHAHNYYLNLLAEAGIPGLLAYLWLLLAAVRLAWRQARHGTGWTRTMALGALGMLGHLIAHSLVDNLYVQEVYLVVGAVLGMLIPNRAQAASRYAPRHISPPAPGAPE
jgi:O-antigen ligase